MDVVMRDNRFGVVVSARGAWASAAELRALGASWVRATVSDFDRLDAALQTHPAEVRVIVALDAEHPGVGPDLTDLAGWETAVRALAERFAGRIAALECLSGWDELGIEPATAVACARRAGQILRDAGADVTCLLGAAVGPDWIESLQEASRLLTAADRELVGGACFHPYAQNARGFPGFDHRRFEHGEIDIAVQNAHDIIQLPIWATEFGVTLQQAGDEAGQAMYVRDAFALLGELPRSVLAAATYFCWWDPVGGPHQRGGQARGLRRRDRFDPALDTAPRPAWYAFAELAGGTAVPPAEIGARQPSLCR